MSSLWKCTGDRNECHLICIIQTLLVKSVFVSNFTAKNKHISNWACLNDFENVMIFIWADEAIFRFWTFIFVSTRKDVLPHWVAHLYIQWYWFEISILVTKSPRHFEHARTHAPIHDAMIFRTIDKKKEWSSINMHENKLRDI